MNHPIERWKEGLKGGTPVFPYVNCSPQTGQYLGLEEYRAAAANAYARGANGVYLFNYPCLFELALQAPSVPEEVAFELFDMRPLRQKDFSRVARALGELGSPERLAGQDKRFLFYFCDSPGYRHHDVDRASVERGDSDGALRAAFWCFEDFDRADAITLRLKVQHVARREQFSLSLNGQHITSDLVRVSYAANGRDTRVHTVTLGPYMEYEVALGPSRMRRGGNALEVIPAQLVPELAGVINLVELELLVRY